MHGARDIKARLIHTITHQKRDAFGHVSNAAALRAIYCDLHGFCKVAPVISLGPSPPYHTARRDDCQIRIY